MLWEVANRDPNYMPLLVPRKKESGRDRLEGCCASRLGFTF